MVYSFELIKHANSRYRDAIPVLARCELFAMLHALSVSSDIQVEHLGGADFLTFDSDSLTPDQLSFLSRHSAVVFMAEQENGLLRPLSVHPRFYLPEDLPEVLKYKGKTSASFSRMMINTALSLSPFLTGTETLSFFDPLCGKGTGCFCALTLGMNASGLDLDRKYISEASDYFSRYLQYHKWKYEVSTKSETFGRMSIPVTDFCFAETKDLFHSGRTRRLLFACADTAASPALFRKRHAHIIVTDLPYGVQHAPLSGSKPESLAVFLRRALPLWRQSLFPGGVIALSFNTLTLSADTVRNAVLEAGLRLPKNQLFFQLRHEVEHAVVRDVVFALNTEEESSI